MTMTTITPVFTWMLTGIDATLGFLESRYLLAGRMVGIYQYCPGKTPGDEWRGVQTFTFNSAEEARDTALGWTEGDENHGFTLFGPTVVAEVAVDFGSWAAAVAEDDGSGMGTVLDFVRGVLYDVQTLGMELG